MRSPAYHSGGGVAAYIREGLIYIVKPEFMPTDLEIIVIENYEDKHTKRIM